MRPKTVKRTVGPPLSYRVIPKSPLLRYAPQDWVAFATANAVHLKGDGITPAMLAHEGTHVRQLREAGGTLVGWLYWIVLLLRHGYDWHPWEVEARQMEQRVARHRFSGTQMFGAFAVRDVAPNLTSVGDPGNTGV